MSRENLIDIFARLGDVTESPSSHEFIVEVRRLERRERLVLALTAWSRAGALRWSKENSD